MTDDDTANDDAERGVALLRSTEIFGWLDDPVIEGLARTLEQVTLAPGDTLMRQGELGDAMFIVETGTLRIAVRGTSGVDVTVGHVEAGQPVGEMQFILGGTRSATVTAGTECRLHRLPHAAIDRLRAEGSPALEALTGVVRRRLEREQLARVLPDILGPVDSDVIEALGQRFARVTLRRGDVPFRQGDPCNGWYIVASGRLQVVVTDPDGRDVVVGYVERGEGLGEIALLTGENRTATPYAVRDTVLLHVSRDAFEELLLRYPRVLMSITKVLVTRATAATAPGAGRPQRNIAVAVIPAGPGAPAAAVALGLARALGSCDPTLHLDAGRLSELGVLDHASSLPETHPSWLRFGAWLEQQDLRHRYIVLETDARPTGWTRQALGRADHVVIVADATATPDPGEVEMALTATTRADEPRRADRTLVLVHPQGTTLPRGTRAWLARRDVDAHHHVTAGDEADIARVARALSGRAVGVALGGGGARGFAHLGVVKALRELRIPIDYIGGTSMGAVMAGQLALGLPLEQIHDLNRRIIATKPFAEFTIPMVAILATNRITASARMSFGDTMIEDLWINYFAVSSNLTTAEMMVHDSGPVWLATRASGALPGIAIPVVSGRHLLVDGGVVNNLPGDVMRERCGGQVIAVNVSPREDLQVSEAGIPSQWRLFWNRVLPFRSQHVGVPSLLDILMRTTTLASAHRTAQIARSVDLYLQPPVRSYGLLAFEKMEALVDCGYTYAMEAAAGWKGPRC